MNPIDVAWDFMKSPAWGGGPPKICSSCNTEVGPFRDRLAQEEYNISGLCQQCQDETYGTGEAPSLDWVLDPNIQPN